MASTSNSIEENTTKKRRARLGFAKRKVRQKQSIYTTVKTGWRKFCKDKQMTEKIDEAVQVCSRIACEVSMLASVHVLRLLEAGEKLPPLDNNFFNRCTSAIANLGGSGEIHSDLKTSRNIYMAQHPSVYESTEKKSYMSQMLVMIAQLAKQNLQVSNRLTFYSRLCKWMRLQIRLHNSDYFEKHQGKIIKSAVSLLVRASTQTQYSLSGQMLACGNASFTSLAKTNIAVPTTTLRKKIGSRCRVADVDEFRTSKLCCACHKKMKGFVLDEEIGSKDFYGVRHCKSSECHRTLWDRDINTAINILRLFIDKVMKKKGLEAFMRKENELVLEIKN